MQDKEIRQASLEYHTQAPPGKLSVQPTKQLTNQRDLALAYSPGVAAACDEIVRDPAEARDLTSRGNLIGVVTNGTAVLGLGARQLVTAASISFTSRITARCPSVEELAQASRPTPLATT